MDNISYRFETHFPRLKIGPEAFAHKLQPMRPHPGGCPRNTILHHSNVSAVGRGDPSASVQRRPRKQIIASSSTVPSSVSASVVLKIPGRDLQVVVLFLMH